MINVLIVGASGYVGAELTKYLFFHKKVNIVALFVSKNSQDAGKKISDVHKQFKNIIELTLQPICDNMLHIINKIDAVFLATDHIVSHTLAPIFLLKGIIVFDLSGAFRINNHNIYKKYYHFEHKHISWLQKSVYGLPEWNNRHIRGAQLIAIPGCYATAVQLGLKPIVKYKLIDTKQIPIINATSGVSGIGRKSTLTTNVCEVSLHPYNIFTHRHQPEIVAHLGIPVIFTPHLGNFSRGILATITCQLKLGIVLQDITNAYYIAYNNKPLIRTYKSGIPSLKSVLNLPFCDIGFVVKKQHIIIVVTEDNLLKGAATQAIQCFNIRFNFPETQSLIK
ncbi:N-acetyl-gamma-glutamyl-phosphate reductase [Buchnera aphidicola (Nipponaphis monzeni)]|uniref:N-acetyl-gamma-glutamyl-phosphate reductase n=1 Tax=Buchnera aphidicola (Nipponaphis monzeni) TaxID=2495405 RepID=A0A455T9Q2_9GAMM|nr:N-acetyl-gamma-glutamyl-phosphate reductase [Buchnera aphidicola]BBI01056.1 N-acetyl-gamma-glutamyl-phosphate reductase [Buchnera aphidicola (Nipponaphis monzeni)]